MLLPSSCLLCGENSPGSLLCPPCTADLPYLPAMRCPQCATPTPAGERCGACLSTPPQVDVCNALLHYAFPADRIIHALKYGHQLAVADWLGDRMSEILAGFSGDLIVPLPLHPTRLQQRGFNQAAEIARRISQRLRIPLDLDHLLRTRATPPQAGLALTARPRNVHNAFTAQLDFSKKHILLVDDVMTSGASLNECARILKLHGARQVSAAIAARALRHQA